MIITEEEKIANEEILLSVSWGKEVLQPLKYHSMEIGPYQCSKRVRRGDMKQAAAEMTELLEEIAEAEFIRKRKAFLDRVERLNQYVHDSRGK